MSWDPWLGHMCCILWYKQLTIRSSWWCCLVFVVMLPWETILLSRPSPVIFVLLSAYWDVSQRFEPHVISVFCAALSLLRYHAAAFQPYISLTITGSSLLPSALCLIRHFSKKTKPITHARCEMLWTRRDDYWASISKCLCNIFEHFT